MPTSSADSARSSELAESPTECREEMLRKVAEVNQHAIDRRVVGERADRLGLQPDLAAREALLVADLRHAAAPADPQLEARRLDAAVRALPLAAVDHDAPVST